MVLKPWQLKLLINYFPPLLINRIRIRRISSDFREMDVVVRKSLLNRNLGGAIFGGSIFSAADPYMALMYWQALAHRGLKCEAWLKAAEIRYRKPSTTDLRYEFRLTEADIEEAIEAVKTEGRFQKWHDIIAVNKQGETCAEIKTQVYLRLAKGKSRSNF